MTAAPSSWPRTCIGLSALPTSDTVTCRAIDDVAGLPVDLDLDGRAVELVERRRPAERVVRLGLLAHLADADDLAAEPPEAADRATSRIGSTRSPMRTSPRRHVDRALVDRLEPRRHRPDLRLDVPAGAQDGSCP